MTPLSALRLRRVWSLKNGVLQKVLHCRTARWSLVRWIHVVHVSRHMLNSLPSRRSCFCVVSWCSSYVRLQAVVDCLEYQPIRPRGRCWFLLQTIASTSFRTEHCASRPKMTTTITVCRSSRSLLPTGLLYRRVVCRLTGCVLGAVWVLFARDSRWLDERGAHPWLDASPSEA